MGGIHAEQHNWPNIPHGNTPIVHQPMVSCTQQPLWHFWFPHFLSSISYGTHVASIHICQTWWRCSLSLKSGNWNKQIRLWRWKRSLNFHVIVHYLFFSFYPFLLVYYYFTKLKRGGRICLRIFSFLEANSMNCVIF